MKPGFRAPAVVAALLLATALAGCGLKGALTQPEKASNMVIRGQDAPAAPAAPAPAPTAAPTEPPLPPPDLPHSNSGTPR